MYPCFFPPSSEGASPLRLFDAGFVTKWGVKVRPEKSSVGFCQACHHSPTLPPVILGFFGFTGRTLLWHLVIKSFNKQSSAATVVNRCIPAHEGKFREGFRLCPSVTARIHTPHLILLLLNPSPPTPVHRSRIIEMWEGLGDPPFHHPLENNEPQLSSAPQKDS